MFAFAYVYLFPGLGAAAGSLAWTSRGELAADQRRAAESMAKVYAPYAQLSAEALSQDGKAMAIGQRLFLNNCATCHGSDARGSKGFPDLTDTDWLYGGTPEKIERRSPSAATAPCRPGRAVGSAANVRDVANYVLSLSGDPHNPIAASSRRKKFAACAACHGVDGKGNQALGAPNLGRQAAARLGRGRSPTSSSTARAA